MTKIDVQNFIADKFVNAEKTFERTSPTDSKLVFHVGQSSASEVKEAVRSAVSAQATWQEISVRDRVGYVRKMGEWLVEQYGDEGAETVVKKQIMQAMGKPLPEADVEVIETSDFIEAFCSIAEQSLVPVKPELDQTLWASKESKIVPTPLGVIAIIKPWNYPLEMIAWSLFPAVLAGNTVVLKPSEKSASVGNIFAQMAQAVDLPAGIINIVHGDGRVGALLCNNSDIDMVSFTGSVAAGKSVAVNCSKRLVKYALELGGNDSAIVLIDADLELTAAGLVWGAFCNAGQVCVGIKKAFVHRSVYGKLTKEIKKIVSTLRPMIDIGPLVDLEQKESVTSFVDDAVSKGAQIWKGSDYSENQLYFPPTVLSSVPDDAILQSMECFGPILPIEPFDDVEEVITSINEAEFGLGASVWSSSDEAAGQVASALDVGMVWINDVNVAFPQTPWGGRRNSGGASELGPSAILNYTFPKHINKETSKDKRRDWWFPY